MHEPLPRYAHTSSNEKFVGYIEDYDIYLNDRRSSGLTPYLVLKDADLFAKHGFIVYIARSVSDPPRWCFSNAENVWGATENIGKEERLRLGQLAIKVLNGESLGVTHGDALDRIA